MLKTNNNVNTINDYKKAELKLTIFTAFNLTDQEYQEITEKVSRKYNFVVKEVEIILDKELIGGVKLVFDSNVIDGSLKGKLQEIRKSSKERV